MYVYTFLVIVLLKWRGIGRGDQSLFYLHHYCWNKQFWCDVKTKLNFPLRKPAELYKFFIKNTKNMAWLEKNLIWYLYVEKHFWVKLTMILNTYISYSYNRDYQLIFRCMYIFNYNFWNYYFRICFVDSTHCFHANILMYIYMHILIFFFNLWNHLSQYKIHSVSDCKIV